ncbi:MAG: molybdenum cofactor guanylyltransferase [Chloroflexi bacterium]|nr:molybdenum cofactor guanylyltransferase [Chloroflexota bacterium]
MAITSIVLAGGKSTRLGKDKAAELIGGESLLQRVLSRLATFSTDIILVTAAGQAKLPDSCSLPSGTRIIDDIFPGGGSLGGIYAGLSVSSSLHNLVVACDMPFLNVSLLQYLLEVSPPFDAVVPRVRDGFEPLHAVYSKSCIAPIQSLLEQGNHRIIDFFPQVKVRCVVEEEVNRFDPEHLSVFNINTQDDLNRARRLALSDTPLFSKSANIVAAKRRIHY